MNSTVYYHLAWKELRALRGFWLALAALVFLLQVLTLATTHDPRGAISMVYNIALAAPAFFAVGCAGAAFAVEREEGTRDFLRMLPLHGPQVFTTKILLAVIGSLAMLLVTWTFAWLLCQQALPEEARLHALGGLWLMALPEALVWGTLFSLLTARPLISICLALFASSTMAHLLAWSVPTNRLQEFDLEQYAAALPYRALVVVLVAIVDIYLGRHWLEEESHDSTPGLLGRGRLVTRERAAAEDTTAPARLLAPDRGGMLARLLWQQLRQSGWWMLVLPVATSLLFVMAMFSGLQGYRHLLLIAVAGGSLMGSCVFLADQERHHFRFFVEHNISPRAVWVTRVLPWAAIVAFTSLSLGGLALVHDSSYMLGKLLEELNGRSWYEWHGEYAEDFPWILPPLGRGLACVAVAFAVGQWASMMIRSGLIAAVAGVALAFGLSLWTLTMAELQVPAIWSVLPLIVIPLWATWWRAPDWVRENTSWSARLRAASFMVLPAAALMIAVPTYRVWQIQPVSNERWHAPSISSRAAEEARTTAELYQRANELYVPIETEQDEKDAAPDPKSALAIEQERLAANAASLELLLRASARPTCAFGEQPGEVGRFTISRDSWLIHLILDSGRELERQGKLDEALERYLATLRTIEHLADWNSIRYLHVSGYFKSVFDQIGIWGAHADQTTDRIRGAMDRLAKLEQVDTWVAKEIQTRYLVMSRFIQGDLAAGSGLVYGGHHQAALARQWLWLKWQPWERERAQRVLNMLTDRALDRLDQVLDALRHNRPLIEILPPLQDIYHGDTVRVVVSNRLSRSTREVLRQVETTWPEMWTIGQAGLAGSQEFAIYATQLRAAQLKLAIASYRREHGALPDHLNQLQGTYFAELPLDPCSGKPFVYLPQGVPKPRDDLEMAQSVGHYGHRWMHGRIAAGVPCLWSSGLDLEPTLVEFQDPADDTKDALGNTPKKEVETYQPRRSRLGRGLPNIAIWFHGYWFPIPEAKP